MFSNVAYKTSAQDLTILHNQKIDSLYHAIQTMPDAKKIETYHYLSRISYSNPDTVLRLKIMQGFIFEAQKQKNTEEEAYALMNLMDFYYYFNHKLFNDNYEHFMLFTKNNKIWEHYFYVYSLKISILIQERNTNRAIEEANIMNNFAEKIQSNFGLGTSNYVLGKIYSERNRYQEAEKFFEQAIDYFSDAKSVVDKIIVYKSLLYVLKQQKKYTVMEKLLPKWEELRKERDKELGFKELAGHFYIDIEYADLYTNMKNFKKAQTYFSKINSYIEKLSPIYKPAYMGSLMNLYKMEEKYNEALTIVNELLEYYKETDNKNSALELLYYKSVLLGKMGRGVEAADLFEHYVITKDSIDEISINAKLDELQTQYEVEKLNMEKQRHQQFIIAMLVVISLLIILTVVMLIYSFRIKLKNKAIVARILEQDKIMLSFNIAQTKTEIDPEIKELAASNNHYQQLFERIENLFRTSNLYTDDSLDRKKLAMELGTNDEYIREAIKICSGQTVTDYINGFRLHYARTLLSQKDNKDTLDVLASLCGFKSRSSFHRLFLQQYGLTPGEFRKLAMK
ncbi:MAG: helix-turn-helix domain-containing protein [Bacteroidales bacterium]|jgi:AraC-like DNA-binding protein|nr:helix-turn-helix domain-containing protein [Bacteroidales bacterium]